MSMIKTENLTFSYPNSFQNVFKNVNIQLDTDWKLGFIGRNGRGKTTLLNLLMGKYEYSGKIYSSVQFDYFPYAVTDKSQLTIEILSGIAPAAQEWEFMRELSLLEVNADVLYRPFETLSGGEQTKALLAALFCNEGHFLLIDEPTNHLDTRGRETVSAYLKKKKGFILVSHDRRFLDGCVDHILSLNRQNIEVQKGNFSSWFENFERQQRNESVQNERLKKEVNRLQQAAKRSSVWSDRVETSKYGNGVFDKGYVGHKSAKIMKRAKSIEARQQQAIEQKSELLKNTETAEKLKLSPLSYYAETLVSFSDTVIYYDGRAVCNPVSFSVKRGDRIVLDGKNGSGKSSLIKLLTGEKIEYSGLVNIGSGLIISYVPQNFSHLQGSLHDFSEKSCIDESLFLTVLRKMNFEREHFLKDISDFSAGQKKKVLLAKSLCESAHLYVWDEPLNYIDIYSRMQIENLIKEFAPTMILVEHDKAFRDEIGTERVSVLKTD